MTPAGKATRRLSLLSGGEKALVALAFVFAVFLARPSPFYILDEVEAALDDANIDRFLQLVRRFSGRAQFVIVTHQKRTMDAADVLYGVSMGKGGITKVISRRLSHPDEAGGGEAEAAEAAEAAWLARITWRAMAISWREVFDLGDGAAPDAPPAGDLEPAEQEKRGVLRPPARESVEEPPGAADGAQLEPLRAARRRDLGAARGGADPRRRRGKGHRRRRRAARGRGRCRSRRGCRRGSRATRRAARRGRGPRRSLGSICGAVPR